MVGFGRDHARLGERQDDAVEPKGETDAGRGLAAQQLDQAVVPAAAAERRLLALGALAVELEGRPGVVVEAAHEARCQRIGTPSASRWARTAREVLRAGGAEVLGDGRGRGDEVGQVGILGVEEAQGVRGQALAFDAYQSVLVGAEMGPERIDVGRPACRVADGVDEDLDVAQAGLAIEPVTELDDLGIDRRTGIPDGLHVPLPELAEPPGLRPVVAEHRTEQRDLDRLRPGLEAVLDIGSCDARRRLRSQRPALALLAAAGSDAEELLLDDVGGGPDAAFEDLATLEEWRLDRGVAVAVCQVPGQFLEALPGGSLVREQVARAPWGAEGGHPMSLASGVLPTTSTR